MTQRNRPSEAEKSASSQSATKKPYHKPEFRFERVFETLALACGKLNNLLFMCRGVRRKS
jgi:hypothetical protein